MKEGKYQAFIKSDRNSEKIEPGLGTVNTENEKSTKDVFPFTLESNEAVISFSEKSTKKYYKLKLTQKEAQNLPM